ncbi:hypothetical protein LXL04_017213 [Taraxacum kok-saghyz]
MEDTKWRTVRRKGRPPAGVPNAASGDDPLTSLYVSNLIGGVSRSDLWKPCAKLGNLSDIYIAGRRNVAGSFFAFVKYANMEGQESIDAVVKGLNEISCRGRALQANCAKNPRPAAKPAQQTPFRPPSHAPRVFHPAIRGAKSFADIAKGGAAAAIHDTIKLDCVPEIKSWIGKSVLIGEIRSFDTICNFPSLLSLEGYDMEEIKYVGGMQVAIKVKTDRAAEVFKANKGIWVKWFIWVDLLGKARAPIGRIVWLKIVRIPLLAWDEANFAAIAGKFGKVLVDVSSFWNCKDVSGGKIYILSNSLKRINEELNVSLLGTNHLVGVFEVDDDWVPFRPFASGSSDESDSDCSGGDGDSILFDDKLEEGEFIPETQPENDVAMEEPQAESNEGGPVRFSYTL